MGKTLAIILSHNLPEYTDSLYEELKRYQDDSFDLEVMDNGSMQQYISKHTTIRFEQNLFFGGALNKAFAFVLENDKYESLLFLNNDIALNGEIFVQALRKELFSNNFALLSPCIAGKAAPWRHMQNWGSQTTRVVKWVDLQSPIFHRKLIEAIGQFDEELYFGWGQELICHDVCQDNNWKIGVCDHISIVHYKKQTFEKGRLFSLDGKKQEKSPDRKAISHEEYQQKFRSSYFNYFKENPPSFDTFEELKKYGYYYSFKL